MCVHNYIEGKHAALSGYIMRLQQQRSVSLIIIKIDALLANVRSIVIYAHTLATMARAISDARRIGSGCWRLPSQCGDAGADEATFFFG